MDIMSILIAVAVIGGTGLCIGLLLGIAGKKFAVEVNEREIQIRELLPGSNCGGCGFAGCDALAKALVSGDAKVGACPSAAKNNQKMAEILGVEAEETVRMTARVKCKGTCDRTENQYHYDGLADCRKLALIPGRGEKACDYGCMGLGSCVSECPFDAIYIQNGVAIVDKENCQACGKCIKVCPNHLIELVPYDANVHVLCSSKAKGKEVKAVCQAGCIGCGLCARQCEFQAITVTENLAHIDAEKCTGCGKCVEKCPTKVIEMVQ